MKPTWFAGYALGGAAALAVLLVPWNRRTAPVEPDAIIVSVPEVAPADVEAQAPSAKDGSVPDPSTIASGSRVGPGQPVGSAMLPPPSPDVPAVRDAVAAYRRGDLAGGDAIRAGVTDPAAMAVLDWAAIRTGGARIAYERIAAFGAAYPDWPGTAWLRRRAEEQFVAEGRSGAALRAFFATSRPVTAGGKLALALALRNDRQPGQAAALVQDLWRHDTFGREFEAKVIGEFGPTLSLADHRFRMERLLFRENWDGAKRAADYAGKGYDTLVKARLAVDSSAPTAGKVLDAVPTALRKEPSYIFSRVQFLRRADKPDEAARLIALVPADPATLVDGDEWWVERRLVARKLLDAGDPLGAYAVTATNVALSTEKRIEAEFHAGWIALRFLDDAATASRRFAAAAALAGTPISRARIAYWQGRAAEAGGADSDAKRFYARAADDDATYYGQLAGDRLGRPLAGVRPASDPRAPERVKAADALTTKAFGVLYDAGLRDLALPLMVEFSKQGGSVAELDAAAEIALLNRDARALLALGKGAMQRGLPLEEHAFPTIGVPSFEPVGPRVEPAMVHAIARQESAFDPAAGSGVGARGLMQLMPATAQATARKFGLRYDAARLTDAVYNAQLGAAHLGDLMDSWKGSHILVFAAYNAGPGNVRKWIDAYGDPRRPETDPVDWVERIPFSETRNYVQRVSENLHVYRRRLEERNAALSAAPETTSSIAVR